MRTVKKRIFDQRCLFPEVKFAPAVLFADEAACLGAAPSSSSYLNAEKIHCLLQRFDVDGISPGLRGFFSENADLPNRLLQMQGLLYRSWCSSDAHHGFVAGGNKECVKKYNILRFRALIKADDIALAKETAKQVGYPLD